MAAKKKTARPAHAPTKYRPGMAAKAEELCKRGATNIDLGKAFKVNPTTITTWMNTHPEFRTAVRTGKDHFDCEEVEMALYKRAIGYTHPETKVFCSNGEIITEEVVKHYPPDTTAATFWVKNRQPDRWREHQQIDLGATDGLLAALAEPLKVVQDALKKVTDD